MCMYTLSTDLNIKVLFVLYVYNQLVTIYYVADTSYALILI